jgi:3-deoxy-D-arabino-heptulosonate 7-phosphate (DAHP) synthase
MSSALENLKLTSIQSQTGKTTIMVGDVTIGKDFVVMAGPCAVESEEQLMQTAEAVKAAGAKCCGAGVQATHFAL